ncbi:MAG: Eco29kI family restriction endonuclease [Corynebacterium sp.]|nr:Eco29kI family restriction endonuclease [Corynebacterium sp.]
MIGYFDPLDYETIGASIVRELDGQPVQSLLALERFDGAGLYALYYTGEHPAYAPLAKKNLETPGSWPIYIGKAEVESARKGDPEFQKQAVGTKLYNRVQNHLKSIEAAENLRAEDFQVRVLAVAPTWISLGEMVAIRHKRPVWNVLIDGLGNHDPGSGRYNSTRPRWDTLHPGRAWATKLVARAESVDAIVNEALNYLEFQSEENEK